MRSQLSPNQNSTLRTLITRKRMENKWSVSRMARELGIAQATLHQSLSLGGGFSYATALSFCKKFCSGETDIEKVLGEREDEPEKAEETAREKAVRFAKEAPFHQEAIDKAMRELSDSHFDDRTPDFFYQRIRDEHFALIQEMAEQSPYGKKPRKRKAETEEIAPPAAQPARRRKIAGE